MSLHSTVNSHDPSFSRLLYIKYDTSLYSHNKIKKINTNYFDVCMYIINCEPTFEGIQILLLDCQMNNIPTNLLKPPCMAKRIEMVNCIKLC